MVLKEPLETDAEDLIPSFEHNTKRIVGYNTPRSEETVQALEEFETLVVPRMIELGWMEEIAKSRAKPFYNETDQTLTAHILPGIEILADIVEQAPGVKSTDFRELAALWTIHDVHKIITTDNGNEFDIDTKTIKEWVEKLSLDEFTDGSLTVDDFQSCAVGLHNTGGTNLDDSTVRFTQLRPYLRLVDAVMSISDSKAFIDEAERPINAVFGTPAEIHVPAMHSVEFEDSVMRTLANKTVYEELVEIGLKPIDIRDNAVLYARSEQDTYPDTEDFLEQIIDRFLDNLRDAYQIFRNHAFLGGDIDSPQSRAGYWAMPQVYEVSDLAKLCLTQTELIQRLVQAAVDQQNRPQSISDESERQIEQMQEETGVRIPKSAFIEGLAALVHTVYREIIPELVDADSEHAYERTLEAAVIHVFGVSEEMQERIATALKTSDNHSSPVNWPYKYLIAKDLHDRYKGHSQTERQEVLIRVLSERLSDFEEWDSFANESQKSVRRELYLQFAKRTVLDGETLIKRGIPGFLDTVDKLDTQDNCYICEEPTAQSSSTPDLLSHRDFDILDMPFVTESEEGEFERIELDDIIPIHSLCTTCQVSLTIRAQQFKTYDQETELHVTIHPSNSVSVASYLRFGKILHHLKTEMFSGNSSTIALSDMGDVYEEIITGTLSQSTGVDALIDREQAFDVGTRMDEASSRLTLPDNSEASIIRGAMCATVAGLLSGVRVCITRHPQLHMNHPETDSLVMYGPELTAFDNLLNNRTDITGLPDRLRILDRLIQMCDKTEAPNLTLEQYSSMDDRSVLPGSRVFSQVQHTLNSSEERVAAARDAINIDAIAAKDDVFAKDMLATTKALGDSLGILLPESDARLASAVMMIACDTLETMESINSTEQVVFAITDDLAHVNELDLELQDLRRGGSAYKFAQQMATAYNDVGRGNRNSFNAIRRPLVDGTITRAMLYTTN